MGKRHRIAKPVAGKIPKGYQIRVIDDTWKYHGTQVFDSAKYWFDKLRPNKSNWAVYAGLAALALAGAAGVLIVDCMGDCSDSYSPPHTVANSPGLELADFCGPSPTAKADDITEPSTEYVPEALETESPRSDPEDILTPQPPAETFDLDAMLGRINFGQFDAWQTLRNSMIRRNDVEVLLSLYSDLIAREDPSVEYLVEDVKSYALRNIETPESFCDGYSDMLLSAFYDRAERHRQGLLPTAVEYVEGILESSSPDSGRAACHVHSALFRNRYVQGRPSALARDLGSRATSNGEKAKTSMRNNITEYDARRIDEINGLQRQIFEIQSDLELSDADRESRLQVLQQSLDRTEADRDRAFYIREYQSGIERIDADLGNICSR